ncbi:urokinase-type plasminogen activator [Eurytemora carolleeae]|uniref:urokinase-type plasminogen activator n=1 Tax=Eurytemora carolleeae TaxID=1294199 RepID=UPI000C7817D4|nr:urokinase-type plasminogen activator [Eurytemora carolleeae]|eukprot:XP_023343330.1 urokinase-type plasminogen activator-like [Eurytemora affinis]
MQMGHPLYISTQDCQANPEIGSDVSFSTFCGINPATNTAEMCPGFVGSPVLCNNGQQDILAGFQSYTMACNKEGVPSTYTKISALRDWIDYTLSKYQD